MLPLLRPFKGWYQITQEFGPTNLQSEPRLASWSHFHRGIDYALPIGTVVFAGGDGTVTFAGWDTTGYGKTVVITHTVGITSRVAHLCHINVAVGDVVNASTMLGLSGSSGNSTGPHLHWEVCSDGWPIHPFVVVSDRK